MTLIDASQLVSLIESENVGLLDIRGFTSIEEDTGLQTLYNEYEDNHIPEAAFINWKTDITEQITLNDATKSFRITSPVDSIIPRLEQAGASCDFPLLCYDTGNTIYSTKLWWVLTSIGHPRAFVLDGGLPAWRGIGGEEDQDPGCPLKRSVSWEGDIPSTPQPGMICSAEEVIEIITSGSVSEWQILDTRSPELFSGLIETTDKRNGHIPGAVNVHYKSLLVENTGLNGQYFTFKETSEVKELFQQKGVDVMKPTIVYCENGVSSTVVGFMLKMLGNTFVRNYDGGWDEWGNRDDVLVDKY